MSANQVVQAFSLTNRWLLYTSMMLAPAQFSSGVGLSIPTSPGFLAYNCYTQIQCPLYHRLCDQLPSGISSGNVFLSVVLAIGTFGVLILNTVCAWISWATNQPEGFGEYQFFFFGWRTLSHGWHIFTLLWRIGDSILVFNMTFVAGYLIRVDGVDAEHARRIPW
ncbi:hypothetical protein BDW60DRAFT_209719 [Aspergillus nidulans var. acristatus]